MRKNQSPLPTHDSVYVRVCVCVAQNPLPACEEGRDSDPEDVEGVLLPQELPNCEYPHCCPYYHITSSHYLVECACIENKQ